MGKFELNVSGDGTKEILKFIDERELGRYIQQYHYMKGLQKAEKSLQEVDKAPLPELVKIEKAVYGLCGNKIVMAEACINEITRTLLKREAIRPDEAQTWAIKRKKTLMRRKGIKQAGRHQDNAYLMLIYWLVEALKQKSGSYHCEDVADFLLDQGIKDDVVKAYSDIAVEYMRAKKRKDEILADILISGSPASLANYPIIQKLFQLPTKKKPLKKAVKK